MEFQCDLNCPAAVTIAFCCKNCVNSKREHITESNKHLWSDKVGFWTLNGCVLGDERPKECKEYDCKDYVVVVERRWNGKAWVDLTTNSIKKTHRLKGIIVEIGKEDGNCSGIRSKSQPGLPDNS